MPRKTTGRSKAPDIMKQDVDSSEILYRLPIDIVQPDDPVVAFRHYFNRLSRVWRRGLCVCT